jgi:hypothetical protein
LSTPAKCIISLSTPPNNILTPLPIPYIIGMFGCASDFCGKLKSTVAFFTFAKKLDFLASKNHGSFALILLQTHVAVLRLETKQVLCCLGYPYIPSVEFNNLNNITHIL